MKVEQLLNLNNGLVYLCGSGGGQNIIKHVDIVEIPEGMNWTTPGDFIITTGYFFRDNPGFFKIFVERLIANHNAGLGIKLEKYVINLPEDVRIIAEENRFPIIKIPSSMGYRDIQTYALRKLYGRGEFEIPAEITNKNAMFLNLINGNILNGSDISVFSSKLGMTLNKPRYVAVVANQYVKDTYRMGNGLSGVRSASSNISLINCQSDGLIALIWENEGVPAFKSELAQCNETLQSLCYEKNVNIGISNLCLRAENLRLAYKNAIFALKLGYALNLRENIHFYDDFLIHRLVKDNINHPSILVAASKYVDPLIKQDRENGSDLFTTLKILSKNNYNIQKSCKDLSIHRNTLYSRFEKICAITGLNPESSYSRHNANLAVIAQEIAAIDD